MVFIPFNEQGKAQEEDREGNFVPFSDNTQRAIDRPDPSISNQNEQGIFDGSTYAPGGDTPENKELYESVGQEGPLGTRLQTTTNDEGEKRTYFVPAPTMPEGIEGSVARSTVGAGLESAKGTLGFGEWMLDTFMKGAQQKEAVGAPNFGPDAALLNLATFADGLLGTKFSETDKNYIDQNFPTLPAQNDVEKAIQEIGSIIIGGTSGYGISKAGHVFEALGRESAQLIHDIGKKFWDTARKTEPDLSNAAQKTQVFIKELADEVVGGGIGATITTPTDVDSISGSTILPDTIGPLSEEETEKLGHFLDNAIIASVFNLVAKPVIGKAAGATSRALGLNQFFDPVERTTAVKFLTDIDPGLKNVSPEEFKRRATAFSEMIKANSSADTGMFGTFERNPVRATFTGAEKYVEEAYGYLKRSMTVEQWENFKADHAALIYDNLNLVRRQNMDSGVVQASDAAVSRQASQAVQSVADQFGGLPTKETVGAHPNTIHAGQTLGQQAKEQIESATDLVRDPKLAADVAQGQMDAAFNESRVIQALQQAKNNNTLGDTFEQRQRLSQMAGPELFSTWERSFNEYNRLFDEIPDNIPVDAERIVDAIVEAGEADNLADMLRMKAPGNLIKPLDEVDPKEVMDGDAVDPYQELLDRWQGKDLKYVFNEVRPYLSQVLNESTGKGTVGIDASGVSRLKRVVDELVESANEPAFTKAMDAYKDHMAVFGQVDSLINYDRMAVDVSRSGGIKQDELYKTATQGLVNALSGADQSGLELTNWVSAIQRFNPNADNVTKELADIIIGSAMANISKGGGKLTVDKVVNAVNPYLPALHTVAPETVDEFRRLVTDLNTAQMGSQSAEQALKEAEAKSIQMITEAKKSAAFKFLNDTSDGIQVQGTGDITKTFNSIFKSESATQDLMNKAVASGDQMVIDGIKAQYLEYLSDRIFTNRTISASGGQPPAVMDTSAANISRILDSSDRTDASVMNILFEDKELDDLVMLLKEVQLDSFARSIRPQTYSSLTAVDNTRMKTFRTWVTLTLGIMNRVATTVGRLGGNVINAQDAATKEQINQIMAKLLTNSDYLTNTLDALGDRPTREALEDAARGLVSLVNNQGTRATTRVIGDRIIAGEDDRTDEAFNIPPLEITVEGANEISPEERQMQEALPR